MIKYTFLTIFLILTVFSLNAETNVFILPLSVPGLSAENLEFCNKQIESYFREQKFASWVIHYSPAAFPADWGGIENIFQNAEIYELGNSISDKLADGGWLVVFLLDGQEHSQEGDTFFSKLQISVLAANLNSRSLLDPVSFVSAALSEESFEAADRAALEYIKDHLHFALLETEFYDRGDFQFAITEKIWVFNTQEGINVGDECIIGKDGYGLVLDKTRKYLKIGVSKKPSPENRISITQYVSSAVELDLGTSVFLDLINWNIGFDSAVELRFKRGFPYIRPLLGISWLAYAAAADPLLVYAGGVFTRLLGRMRFDFSADIGLAQSFSPKWTLSHFGARFAFGTAIQISGNFRIQIEAGILSMFGISAETVNGITAGISVVIQ